VDTSALAAKAMEGGDVAWVVTTALGALCGVLLIVVGFFLKKTFNERERKENLLERRLSSGSETMQKMKDEFHGALEGIRDSFRESIAGISSLMTDIKNTIMTVQSNDIQKTIEISKMVSQYEFEEFRARNQKEQDEMKKSILDLRDAVRQVSEELKDSVSEMKGCVLAVRDLATKIVNRELGSSTD